MSIKERKLETIERVLHLSLNEELDVVKYALEALAAHSAPDDYTPIMPMRSAEELRARFNQVTVHGISVNARTQCAHYHSERDIIAIKHKCCDTFYACIQCHNELADHAPVVWPKDERQTAAILCGNCHSTLSIAAYLACNSSCPMCRAAFNPGCANHYPLYFEM